MFSTVRGKEYGSTTKSKKDMGVSAADRGEILQDGAWLPLTLSPTPVPAVGVNRHDPSGGSLANLLKPGMAPGPAPLPPKAVLQKY